MAGLMMEKINSIQKLVAKGYSLKEVALKVRVDPKTVGKYAGNTAKLKRETLEQRIGYLEKLITQIYAFMNNKFDEPLICPECDDALRYFEEGEGLIMLSGYKCVCGHRLEF